MDYKTKLQTNNNNLEGNNIDLQSILNTINELPAAGSGKTTKTIYIDWSGDEALLCSITYISNNQLKYAGYSDDYIEAEGGIIRLHSDNIPNYTSNFIDLYHQGVLYILVATQDGETVYPISTGEQDN